MKLRIKEYPSGKCIIEIKVLFGLLWVNSHHWANRILKRGYAINNRMFVRIDEARFIYDDYRQAKDFYDRIIKYMKVIHELKHKKIVIRDLQDINLKNEEFLEKL